MKSKRIPFQVELVNEQLISFHNVAQIVNGEEANVMAQLAATRIQRAPSDVAGQCGHESLLLRNVGVGAGWSKLSIELKRRPVPLVRTVGVLGPGEQTFRSLVRQRVLDKRATKQTIGDAFHDRVVEWRRLFQLACSHH